MKLNETDPSFQAIIGRIAAVAGQTADYVYTLWQEYERECQAADQSAVLPEFIQWYKTPLGGNKEQLEAAIVDHMAADEPQGSPAQAVDQVAATEQPEPEKPQKWQVDPADPPGRIQAGKFNKAHGGFGMAHGMMRELSGVIGGEEHDQTYCVLFGGSRADVTAAQVAIGKRFNWTVSRDNVGEIISAIESALVELKKTIPVVDKRLTAEAAAARDEENRKAREERDNAEAVKRTNRLAEVTRLRAENRWVTGEGLRDAAKASANCKLELQTKWPHAGWSVRCDNSSLRIEWLNGPTVKQVSAIADKYRSDYGSASAEVFGRVSYLSYRREYGSGPYQTMVEQTKVADAILALEGIERNGREHYQINLPRFVSPTDVACAARQVMEATEIPVGSEIEGVAWFEGTGAAIPPNVYQLTLTVATAATATPAGGALGTVRHNAEHNGCEISFFEKPTDALRAQLQRAGFRITRRPPWKWYTKWSESAYARACELAGVVNREELASTGNRVEANDPAGGYVQAQEDAYFDRQAEAIGA